MKRRLFAGMLAACMALTLAGCHDKEDLAQIEDLKAQILDLQIQNDSLNAKIDALQCTTLKSWTLEAAPKEDGTGASVKFTAEPAAVVAGQTANFIVVLGEEELVNLPCSFDGTIFHASAELDSKNGYSFFCRLTDGGDQSSRVALLDPENAVLPYLMNLGESMDAYCNFFVDGWTEDAENHKLLITSAAAEMKLPRFRSTDAEITFEQAAVELRLGDEVLSKQDVEFTAEGNLYTAELQNAEFDLPEEMEAEAQLNLVLHYTLNGQENTVPGASWFRGEEALEMVTG